MEENIIMKNKIIEMGDKVRDRITNFEGVVIAINRWAFNVPNVAIQKQTPNKEGGIDEALWFDTSRLEIIEKGILKEVIMPCPPEKFDFLDIVKDKITNFEGKVISITQWITGCVRIGIISPDKKDNENKPLEMCLPQDQVILKKKIGNGPGGVEEKKSLKPYKGGPMKNPSCY
jgi:hypothetical protein